MNKFEYRDYVRYNSNWKSLRRKVHHKYKICQSCGSDKNLDVHHKTYKRVGHERLSDLKLYCRTCHYWEHNREKGFWNIRPSYIIHWIGCYLKRNYRISKRGD